MSKRLIFGIAAMVALLVVTASATGSSAHRAAAAGPAGSVTLAVGTDPGNLDPQLTIVSAARYVDTYAYDTLVNLTGPGQIASGLAQSWKVVSPTKVTFTLHKGIKCTDGTKMTATVVKKNLDFVGDPKNKSPLLGLFMPVGATTTANNAKRTVTVTTATPNPFMIQGLGLVQMVCAKGLANRSILAHGTDGTGPYALTSGIPGDHYTFVVRKGYKWGPNGVTTAMKGLPAKVTLKVVTNETTSANLLLTGGLNLATIAGPDRSRLDKSKLFKIVSPAQPNELFFNENPGHPAANPAVRKAIVQALNLGQIGNVATSGRGLKMTQLSLQNFTPCSGNSVTGNVPRYNPSAARSVLGSAGNLKLLYATDAGPSYPPSAELLQAQLQSAGGHVTLEPKSTAALQGTIFGSGDWDVLIIGIGVANPSQFTGLVSGPTPSQKGANFANISNATYGKDVASAMKQVGTKGCKTWLAAESALFKGADIAPLAVSTSATYGKHLSFRLGVQGPVPTSLRLTK
jgi:peptide/nickel transport system substrate-binding protein